jgi:hypothetical protein
VENMKSRENMVPVGYFPPYSFSPLVSFAYCEFKGIFQCSNTHTFLFIAATPTGSVLDVVFNLPSLVSDVVARDGLRFKTGNRVSAVSTLKDDVESELLMQHQ